MGGGLIPPVDNINTFETTLDVLSDNKLMNDTAELFSTDGLAIGHIGNDPEFGTTHANGYLDMGRLTYGNNPYKHKDSVIAIDSVVLSLSFEGHYGDTNSFQTIRVFEIDKNSDFRDTSRYKFNHPDFTTTGPQLGSKTFQVRTLDDTLVHIRKRDTTKMVNVIRIRLDNSLGVRLSQYDTSNTTNGAYFSDSAFKKAFKGFALKADNSGNAITYINTSNLVNTALVVYCQLKNGSTVDTTSVTYSHFGGRLTYGSSSLISVGQANVITRTPGSNWASYLSNGNANDNLVYLQSAPGSFAEIKIPGLDTFRNAVIHRAELITYPVSSLQQGQFVFPTTLFLDKINSANDTAFTFDKDMEITKFNLTGLGGSLAYNLNLFGGSLKSDSCYRFNISRHMQDIITLKKKNYTLRLYAPMRTFLYSEALSVKNQIFVNSLQAYGRIVLTGGSYADPAKKMRLRIIYSKL